MSDLKPFKSDGCSLWPDGNYGSCCAEHDRAYHRGGSRAERRDADIALRLCVARQGRPLVAAVMYLGVRIGGHPWWPLPWRWGFGRKWPCGYGESSSP